MESFSATPGALKTWQREEWCSFWIVEENLEPHSVDIEDYWRNESTPWVSAMDEKSSR